MNKYFQVEEDGDGIVWLSFDTPGKAANVLTAEALEEFDTRLVTIAQSHPKGLVIRSAKKNGFITGADVKAFARIATPQEAQNSFCARTTSCAAWKPCPFPPWP